MKRVHIIKKDDYKIKKKIGSGAYGFINLVEEKKNRKTLCNEISLSKSKNKIKRSFTK